MRSHALHQAQPHADTSTAPYSALLMMMGLSFVSMYLLMYAMADSIRNVYPNFNQLYMAGLMTSPMTIIELFPMKHMYRNKRANALIIAASAIALILCFGLIRNQAVISDAQFLRSMIPRHSGAILMCRQASLSDASIKSLCEEIISSQQREIDRMKAKLREFDS